MIRPVRGDGRIETGGAFVPIPRRRVIDRIASAAMQRVVLLIAPAGYGKTVALGQYLATVDEPYVRFDVQPAHAGLLGFLRGLAVALAAVAPDALVTLAGAFDYSVISPTPGADLALWMYSHLTTYQGIVVIDDLHVAQDDPEVMRFVTALIDRTKGRVQWIIGSRSSAGLPIGTWLAYGESDLAIDEHDLKFTADEAREAARAFRLGVRDDELAELLRLTDGWATAMSFALRSSTRSADLREVTMTARDMTYRYLAEQVWSALREDERAFLETAALLAEIEIAVMVEAGFGRAAALVEELQARVAFLHEREDAKGTYRVHDLFREFAFHQLVLRGAQSERAVRLRLADALARLSRVAIALRLFVEADAPQEALPLLEGHGFDLVATGHGDLVAHALKLFDGSTHPMVIGLRGVAAIGEGRFDDGEHLLMLALKHATSPELRGALTLRAAMSRFNRGRDASDLFASLLHGGLPEAVRLEAEASLAAARALQGRHDDAQAHLTHVLDAIDDVEDEALLAKLLHRSGLAVNYLGAPGEAKPLLERSAEIARRIALWSLVSRNCGAMALIAALHDNDLHASLEFAQAGADAAAKAGDYTDLHSSLLQMLSLETRRGNLDRVVALERQLAELRANDASRTMYLASSQAYRYAWTGRFADAHRLLAGVIHRLAYAPDRAESQAVYALCFALDRKKKESGAAIAAALGDIAQGVAKSGEFGMVSFEIALLFCALGEALNGRHTVASRLLKRRPVCKHDAMRALRDAVETLVLAARTPSYVVENLDEQIDVLVQAGYGGYARFLPWVRRAIDVGVQTESTDLARLTPAELRIVRALASGMTPKDIALESGRSVFTVQTHIQNVIDKLRCHGRAEAIATVRRMGLLGKP